VSAAVLAVARHAHGYGDRVSEQPTAPATPAEDSGAAPLAPVDVDGVRAVTIGTILWAVALIALLPFTDTLRDDGHLWWIGTCAVGVLLGLSGLGYTVRRRNRLRRRDG